MKKLMLAGLILLVVVVTGCSTTQQGALGGAALGAGTGAIIGHNTHYGTGRGALVGGLVGGLAGALAGDAYQQSQDNQAQRRRNASDDYAHGNFSTYDDMWE